MKKIFLTGLLISTTFFVYGQKIDEIIHAKEAERIEKFLSSDEMRGRKTFSPEIDKAADFISEEFKESGLLTWKNNGSFKQEFIMIQPRFISISGIINNETVEGKNIIAITSQSELKINEKSGYEILMIASGANLIREARSLIQSGKNLIVIIDSSHTQNFGRLTGLKRGIFKSDKSVVFILTEKSISTFSIEAKHEITEQKLANVVGVLPGNSKKDEYIVFSAHYDHVGVGKPVNGDSIFNGANDNAAGTTAVMMLSKYFKALGNNDRTIIFAAFTAEEIGGFGSQYFSQQLNPEKVKAMFNIEMIGTESKWGKNSAFITGYEKTDIGSIMQKTWQEADLLFIPIHIPNKIYSIGPIMQHWQGWVCRPIPFLQLRWIASLIIIK